MDVRGIGGVGGYDPYGAYEPEAVDEAEAADGAEAGEATDLPSAAAPAATPAPPSGPSALDVFTKKLTGPIGPAPKESSEIAEMVVMGPLSGHITKKIFAMRSPELGG